VVIPLEIWDLPVAGKLLQEWRDDATFPARVGDAVVALVAAPATLRAWDGAMRAWDELSLRAIAAIRHVHVAGGGATRAVEAAIAARGFTCSRDDDPFTAARWGARMHGLCADVGQTSIKLARAAGQIEVRRIARDLSRAPLRDEVPLDHRDAARETTLDFLASLLVGSSRALVALPCEIVAGVPRSCSYCWRDPDPDLVPELARRSGATIEIVNDAVLAALAAPAAAVPTLVVTIGFGVGGAILLP
jgi:hypothetical protein